MFDDLWDKLVILLLGILLIQDAVMFVPHANAAKKTGTVMALAAVVHICAIPDEECPHGALYTNS